MISDQFYICEEDNVFEELSALYEEIKPPVYADAPNLDLSLEYEGVEEYLNGIPENLLETIDEEAYSVNTVDVYNGDIVLASVYQEGENINLAHSVRPFLVISANAHKAYGFQFTTSNPSSLLDYLVEVSNWSESGLNRPCSLLINMVRGVQHCHILRYIGHITNELKHELLNKLYDIKENKNGLYTNCMFNDRIDITIENVKRIRC
jgi:hypothetical protein